MLTLLKWLGRQVEGLGLNISAHYATDFLKRRFRVRLYRGEQVTIPDLENALGDLLDERGVNRAAAAPVIEKLKARLVPEQAATDGPSRVNGLVVSDCLIDGTAGNGLEVDNAQNCIFTGMVIKNTGRAGIVVGGRSGR